MPNAVAIAACCECEECPLSTPSQKDDAEREEMALIVIFVPVAFGFESGLFTHALKHDVDIGRETWTYNSGPLASHCGEHNPLLAIGVCRINREIRTSQCTNLYLPVDHER